jgi:hypothetical protein
MQDNHQKPRSFKPSKPSSKFTIENHHQESPKKRIIYDNYIIKYIVTKVIVKIATLYYDECGAWSKRCTAAAFNASDFNHQKTAKQSTRSTLAAGMQTRKLGENSKVLPHQWVS